MRIIIISDLWGGNDPPWLKFYYQIFPSNDEVVYYDICDLSEMSVELISEKDRHDFLTSGGIDTAVDNLIYKESGQINILGLSVGGVVGWKFGLKSGRLRKLFTISSTRLRLEKEKPIEEITMYFGEKDKYAPNVDWLCNMNVSHHFSAGEEHNMYMQEHFVKEISGNIVDFFDTGNKGINKKL